MSQIVRELGMGKQGNVRVYVWVRMYKKHGSEIFNDKPHNRSYSKEFKEKVVREYLAGHGSLSDLQIKYGIPSMETIRNWISMYNKHIEMKDYDPKPEVYMAESRKTTLEERKEIVKYCLEHDRDIKTTASLYKCSYQQVRSWVLKYEENGDDGLLDRRGKRKDEDELTELEKAQRKIAQLEREKEEFRKKYELLKKAEQLERW
ncbi:MAG: transposase [Erysipelotrichaceae bacterium]|nr:transposase [Erysipelotrichaceae bacterium]